MIDPQTHAGAPCRQHLREVMGSNKPIPVRYGIWLEQLVQGNFGYSYSDGATVLRTILIRLPPTLELMGISIIMSTILGTLFGVLASLRQYSFWDYFLYDGLTKPISRTTGDSSGKRGKTRLR